MVARNVLPLALLVGVQACGFFDVDCYFREAVDSAGDHLIGHALTAFTTAMDHLFDNDISPMIDKAESAINACEAQVAADVNATVNHLTDAIKSIINDAAQTAKDLAQNITQDIEKIIADGSNAVEKAETTFFTDASKLLDQLNAIVQKGQCMEAGGAKQLQDVIYKLLKELSPFYRVSRCWRGLGYHVWQTLEDLTDIQLYNYQKECTLLNRITPTTPIHGPNGILEIYAQGQLFAAEYHCIGETAGSPAFQDVFMKEWVWWGVQYNLWKKVDKTQVLLTTDPSCGTPVECYAQAIKALNNAEQQIAPLQVGLVEMNRTLTEVNQTLTEVNQTLIEVNQTAAANQVATAANQVAIDEVNQTTIVEANQAQSEKNAVNNRLDALEKGTDAWCDCYADGQDDMPSPADGCLNPWEDCHTTGCSKQGYFSVAQAFTENIPGTPVWIARPGYWCCRPCYTSTGMLGQVVV